MFPLRGILCILCDFAPLRSKCPETKGNQAVRRETQPPDLEAKRPTDEYYNSLDRKVAVTNASTSAWVL
jgi:hypothetical protein